MVTPYFVNGPLSIVHETPVFGHSFIINGPLSIVHETLVHGHSFIVNGPLSIVQGQSSTVNDQLPTLFQAR
jgi:hypothetical protein